MGSIWFNRTVWAISAAVTFYWLASQLVPLMVVPWVPHGWLSAFPSKHVGLAVWLELLHTLALLVAAIPVAFALRMVLGKSSLGVAMAAALITTTWDVASYWWTLPIMPAVRDTVVQVVTVIDDCELLVILPLLVWALLRVVPNLRWSGHAA